MDCRVVSAIDAHNNFGKLVRRVENTGHSVVIERRGAARAVLLSFSDYVRLIAPEPEILHIIGENSKRRGTDKLTDKQINEIIKAARCARPRARKNALKRHG